MTITTYKGVSINDAGTTVIEELFAAIRTNSYPQAADGNDGTQIVMTTIAAGLTLLEGYAPNGGTGRIVALPAGTVRVHVMTGGPFTYSLSGYSMLEPGITRGGGDYRPAVGHGYPVNIAATPRLVVTTQEQSGTRFAVLALTSAWVGKLVELNPA